MKIVLFAALTLAMSFLSACGSPQATRERAPVQPGLTPTVPDSETIGLSELRDDGRTRVALLLPLTGEQAALGESLLSAAEMALFDLADDELVLVVRDTQGTPAGARNALAQALDQRVELVIGPLFSSSAQAAGADLRRTGVPMLAFSNDNSIAGGGVYAMGLAPDIQVMRVIDYAARQGRRYHGLLVPASDYGDQVSRAAREAGRRFGTEVVREVSYPPGTNDASTQVRALSDARFDSLLLAAGGEELLAQVPLLSYYDIDVRQVQLLGTRLWEDPAIAREGDLHGGWFAAPPRRGWERFAERYRRAYGQTPPRVASLGYDATALAAVLLREAREANRRPYGRDDLLRASGFSGVDGIFRLLPDGRVERGLAIYVVTANGPEMVEEAPQSFDLIIN